MSLCCCAASLSSTSESKRQIRRTGEEKIQGLKYTPRKQKKVDSTIQKIKEIGTSIFGTPEKKDLISSPCPL
jgi:hypothetical protein